MSRLFLIYLGSLLIRSSGVALIAGICSWKVRNVAVRHAVWAVVLAAMLFMPVFDALLPAVWVPVRVQQIAALQKETFHVDSLKPAVILENNAQSETERLAAPVQARPFDGWRSAAVLYILVALAMFGRLMMGYRKIRKLRRTGKPIAGSVWKELVAPKRLRWRIPVLLESEAVQVPMTIGFFRPAVILPVSWKDWDDWKLRAVLLHEMAHVRRCDWGTAALAALTKCAYWLNPLSWFLERQLSKLAKDASDDASISCIGNTTRYAEILLEFALAAQNGGRFMKRGVAMAHYKIQSRIERVLRHPKSGTGILKIAGWILVLIVAVPVIYSAAALQVASSRAPTPPILQYRAAAFAPAPATQVPADIQQLRRPSGFSGQAAELQDLFELERQTQNTQQQYDSMRRKLAEAQLQQSLERVGQTPERIIGTTEFLTRETAILEGELERLQSRIKEVQLQPAAQPQVNPPNAPSSAQPLLDLPDPLLDLPDNEADLLAYLKELARIRANGVNASFSVSFMGIQGRTVAMKVSGKDYAFGCESCSFFVGESVVGNAASPLPSPGMLVRLSSDGNELLLTCRAALCDVRVEGENASDSEIRRLPSGSTESFRTAKKISVDISKN